MSETESPASTSPAAGSGRAGGRTRLTVVVNPTKVDDLEAAKTLLSQVCRRHGWAEPTWVETTEDETGERQSRDAVAAGADVVASLGGDGTVRSVATGLVGTDVALGLLPAGTGNLLARNLGLPVDSLERAAEAMVGGSQRRVDVGLVRTGSDELTVGQGRGRVEGEEVFLVMAGLGLDGEVMAGTNDKVKGVLGWPAYAMAAATRLVRPGFAATVDAEGASEPLVRHCRTVLVGNCGMLQAGVELMPDARPDDGILDLVVVAPHGFFGWFSVLGAVASRGRVGHRRLDRLRATTFTIAANRPVEAEVDGDPIGEHEMLAVRVLPDSLVVRSG